MFERNVVLLGTNVIKDNTGAAGYSKCISLSSRRVPHGIIINDERVGNLTLNTPAAPQYLLISAHQQHYNQAEKYNQVLTGRIAERIIDYLEQHYIDKHTNCASFVEYLRTGVLRECDMTRSAIMFSGGFNFYTGQKVRVGDTLCIFYYSKAWKTRRTRGRREYMKKRDASDDLTLLQRAGLRSFTSDELVEVYRTGVFMDYHFMHCIDVYQGKPVFIQQVGRNDPRNSDSTGFTPVMVSIGMTDMSYDEVPGQLFINRGRHK